MTISIALCTYNGAAFLGEQLASFARQTRLPDELVVCDDCSTDSTVDIVRQFAAQVDFPVRLYVNEKNLRSTKNFERAISLCAGDIIALSDQDDVWHADKLKVFAEIFAAKPAVGMVFCNANLVDENLKSLGVSNWDLLDLNGEKRLSFISGTGLEYLLKGAFVWGCMTAFRARYKDLILPIPEDLPDVIHDSWTAVLIGAIAPIQPIAECLVDYRQHSAQQLGQQKEAVVKTSFVENISRRYDHDEEITRLNAFGERLRSVAENFDAENALETIDSRLRHFSRRREMQNSSLWKKSKLVARELFSRRYRRHTSGLKSAAKDLFTT